MSLETALKEYDTLTEEDRNRFKELIDDGPTEAQKKELDRRLKLYDEGKMPTLSLEELKQNMKDRYGL